MGRGIAGSEQFHGPRLAADAESYFQRGGGRPGLHDLRQGACDV